ncbi:MAG: CocE/NonD family hydrolase [Gammaproteobacteria bacterium]|nr:CocE/NonD family hydrolase [Gammaproteobacteria bacterium]
MNRIKLVNLVIAIVSIFISTALSAKICVQLPNFSSDKFQFKDDIKVSSFDGSKIAANVFTPKGNAPANGYPAIIFVNSWVLEEHQYIIQAKQFAEKGYIVFSYSARGWGCSEGEVNVGGPKDIQDLGYVIDWLIANTNVDQENIGISGISYGSGISLLGLAQEPRIKTAVAMSTWGSLSESLYQNETPRLFWGFLLVSSGFITADLEAAIGSNYANLVFNRKIPQTLDWAAKRSVDQYIDLINARNAPVYLSNNFGDNLFQPNNLMKFYEKLTVPKRLDLSQGTHASAEGFGMVGLNSYTWNNTHRWFDYWLKGIQTNILSDPPVTMDVAGTVPRQNYSNWPIPEAVEQTFHLAPRGLVSNGELRTSPYSPWWPKKNTIHSGIDTIATTGIPLLSEVLDAHLNLPVKTWLNGILRTNGIFFESRPLSNKMRIRGIPKIQLNIEPSLSQYQLNAYLYDVAPNGIGTLITHGPFTEYDATSYRDRTINWEMVATAYDIPRGHRLAVAFDTFDALYAVPTILPYKVEFKFNNRTDSTLTVPVVQ